MLCLATQDRQVICQKSSDKTWSTREENGKQFQNSCRENPTNSMKSFSKNKRQVEDVEGGSVPGSGLLSYSLCLSRNWSISSKIRICRHNAICRVSSLSF